MNKQNQGKEVTNFYNTLKKIGLQTANHKKEVNSVTDVLRRRFNKIMLEYAVRVGGYGFYWVNLYFDFLPKTLRIRVENSGIVVCVDIPYAKFDENEQPEKMLNSRIDKAKRSKIFAEKQLQKQKDKDDYTLYLKLKERFRK